jgi:PAS domain-containing protein
MKKIFSDFYENNFRIFNMCEVVGIPMCVTTIADGTLLFANDSFLDTFKIPTTMKYLGKTTTELNLWDNEKDRVELTQELKKNKIVKNKTIKMKKFNKEEIFVKFNLKIWEEYPTCIIGTAIDITNEIKQKEELAKLNEKYSKLLDATEQSYIIIDKNGDCIDSNNQFKRIVNIENDENFNFFNFLPENLNSIDKLYLMNENEIVINQINTNKKIWTIFKIEKYNENFLCILEDISRKKMKEMQEYIKGQKQKDKLKQNIYEIRNQINEFK